MALTGGFALVEAVGGLWSGSLALLSDAGHMVTDATALGMAAAAAWLARRPPSPRHSYGLGRIETIAAVANVLLMAAVVAGIVTAAVDRLQQPRPVAGGAVMAVAAAGLLVNLVVALVLSRGELTLNVRGALLHVMGDLLGSVAALVSGAVIHFTGWTPIDPLLSLGIAVLILVSALRLLHEALHVLMEGVPRHLDLEEVGMRMARTPGVRQVHDLHIWTLPSGEAALSAHVVLARLEDWPELLERLSRMLERRYRIRHLTLQPEPMERTIPAGRLLARERPGPPVTS